jgi:hypothetical protein
MPFGFNDIAGLAAVRDDRAGGRGRLTIAVPALTLREQRRFEP